MEKLVGVAPRLVRLWQRAEPLDEMPERVRVQHEATARHDVGPVARFVLLQQEEALVLLTGEPVDRPLDVQRPAFPEPALRAKSVEERDGGEPPERGVDAAEVPEIRFSAGSVDELRDLAV